MKNHANNRYHLAALALKQRQNTTVSNLPIRLPNEVVCQVKVLFNTVLYMSKSNIANCQRS